MAYIFNLLVQAVKSHMMLALLCPTDTQTDKRIRILQVLETMPVWFSRKKNKKKTLKLNTGRTLEKLSLTRSHARLPWHQRILSVRVTHALIPRSNSGTLMRKMWASYLLKRGSASLLETAALTAPPGCQTEMQGLNRFLRDANWPKLNALQQLAYKKIRGKCSFRVELKGTWSCAVTFLWNPES